MFRHLPSFTASLIAVLALLVAGCGDPPEPLPADTLVEPVVVRSDPAERLLDVQLEVVLDTFEVPGSGTQALRAYRLVSANTYQGPPVTAFPGPTFRVQPGDSVRIRLVNRLPPDPNPHACMSYAASTSTPPRDTFPNCFHGPNSTNVHYHGFHVTPEGSGDNVLIEIPPDSAWQFAFGIPLDQSPGTHWYHPHKHGAVAIQVTNGMAGAFVVEGGGLDSMVTALGLREHLIAVQQVDSALNLVNSGVRATKLVNGQLDPVIVMRPNEVQRWRVVNENVSASTTYKLVFEGDSTRVVPALYDVARDGVQFAPANYDPGSADTSLILAPGNRLDVFVQAPPSAGEHQLNAVLVADVQARNELPEAVRAAGTPQPLLTVLVIDDGAPVPTELPEALPELPAFLANLEPTTDTAAFIVFSETGSSGGGANPPRFYLGTLENPQMQFDPTTPFLTLPLGATQTWKVLNLSTNQINHPFHIHVNPFQVIEVGYDPSDPNAPLYAELNAASRGGNPVWMDTFALPLPDSAGNPGTLVLRQRYVRYTGRFVMHCHVLGHEERGMMQLVEIVASPAPGQ